MKLTSGPMCKASTLYQWSQLPSAEILAAFELRPRIFAGGSPTSWWSWQYSVPKTAKEERWEWRQKANVCWFLRLSGKGGTAWSRLRREQEDVDFWKIPGVCLLRCCFQLLPQWKGKAIWGVGCFLSLNTLLERLWHALGFPCGKHLLGAWWLWDNYWNPINPRSLRNFTTFSLT